MCTSFLSLCLVTDLVSMIMSVWCTDWTLNVCVGFFSQWTPVDWKHRHCRMYNIMKKMNKVLHTNSLIIHWANFVLNWSPLLPPPSFPSSLSPSLSLSALLLPSPLFLSASLLLSLLLSLSWRTRHEGVYPSSCRFTSWWRSSADIHWRQTCDPSRFWNYPVLQFCMIMIVYCRYCSPPLNHSPTHQYTTGAR